MKPIRLPARQPRGYGPWRTQGAGAWWAALALLGLGLNAVWEIAQHPLYLGGGGAAILLGAATADAAAILAAVAVARIVSRGRRALLLPLVAGLLGPLAAGIEVWALSEDRWAYASAMPTIAGIGLAPLLQLPLLGLVGVLLATWRNRRGPRRTPSSRRRSAGALDRR